MTKLSIEQILNIPQLSFYLEAEEFSFIAPKSKDFESLANVYNSEKVEVMLNIQSNTEFDLSKLDSLEGKSDSIMTGAYGQRMKQLLIKNSKNVSKDALVLLLGSLAKMYLSELNDKNDKSVKEIVYSNGDIIVVKDGRAFKKSVNGVEEIDIQDLKENLAEAMLIANKEMQEELKKNRAPTIKGAYAGRGIGGKRKYLTFSAKELDKACKSEMVFNVLSVNKIKEFYNKRYYSYSDIMRVASNPGGMPIEKALILYKSGIIKKEDILRKVLKVNDFETLLKKKDVSSELKFLIYGLGEVGITSLDRNLKNSNDRENRRISKETFKTCAKFFNDKKIGELLTHDILNYEESKDFLKVLLDEKVITPDKVLYFEQVMEDFRCNELLNKVESETLEGSGEERTKYKHTAGLTIDPKLRLDYLTSIGTVKRVRINGEMAISDSESKKRKYNSLDGYELLIIPDKRVAILEKFYEVTRNKEGQMVYKKDKEGNNVPATEHATYILPIGIAKQLVENKNKKDLIKSKYVHRTFHTVGWVENLQRSMKKVNPEIEFEKTSTVTWAKRIAESYEINKKARGLGE